MGAGEQWNEARKAVLLAGHSPWSAEEIERALPGGLRDVPGDWVIGVPGEWVATSAVGASPWYWARSADGRLVHGPTVYEVASRAGLAWEWNPRAIHSLAVFGHPVGADTLHPRVNRLAPATRVSVAGGEIRIEPLRFWNDLTWDREDSPGAAVSALASAFAGCVDEEPLISLSAGFDSRTLLALALARGLRPRLAVMGDEASTDVVVAKAIAGDLGLPISVVQIRPDDYLSHGRCIAELTSGAKLAQNWHTWLYGLGIEGDPVHLVGSNGEFARSYYLHSPLLEKLPALPPAAARAYVLARLANRARKFPRGSLGRPGLAELLSLSAPAAAPGGGPTLQSAMDVFYARERVHHFIASGAACYADFSRPRSPFLDPQWIAEIARLGRRWKHGSRFHREVIGRHAPELLEYPFNAPPGGGASVLYQTFPKLAAKPQTRELLLDSPVLDDLIPRRRREAALAAPGPARLEEVNLLITLHFAGTVAAEHRPAPAA